MNPFASKDDDEKINPRNILGGILGGFDEIGFEMETPSVSSVTKGVGDFASEFLNLGKDVIGIENKSTTEAQKFPKEGTIEFNNKIKEMEEDKKQKEEAATKRIFFQALKEDASRVENATDRMIIEAEIADIGANISTEEKNEMLHYQLGYKDRSIYQMAELRKKIIEQRRIEEEEKKDASLAATKPQATAMQTAFEGASGTQGAGQANLSFQAAG